MPESTHVVLQDDTPAARRELAASQYGQYANAEELIRAHVERTPPEVSAALRRQVDEGLTKTLDFSAIEVPEGGTLLDAVVRGSYVSFVYETEDGDQLHGAVPYEGGTHAADDPDKAAATRAEVLGKAEAAHIEAEAGGPEAAAEEAAADDDDGATGEDGWPEKMPGTHDRLDALAEEHGIEFEEDASVADKKAILEDAKAEEASG